MTSSMRSMGWDGEGVVCLCDNVNLSRTLFHRCNTIWKMDSDANSRQLFEFGLRKNPYAIRRNCARVMPKVLGATKALWQSLSRSLLFNKYSERLPTNVLHDKLFRFLFEHARSFWSGYKPKDFDAKYHFCLLGSVLSDCVEHQKDFSCV